MKPNYYNPDPREFRIGIPYEEKLTILQTSSINPWKSNQAYFQNYSDYKCVKHGDQYLHTVWQAKEYTGEQPGNEVRMRYLDSNDIKLFGFKESSTSDSRQEVYIMEVGKKIYHLGYTPSRNLLSISLQYGDTFSYPMFMGQIKNYNELLWILRKINLIDYDDMSVSILQDE
jgi:hypothetical protein